MNRDLQMYGMTREDVQEQYMNSFTAKHSGLEMVVMQILSDCQNLTEIGQSEAVRKQLNVAKFILCEMMDAKERV